MNHHAVRVTVFLLAVASAAAGAYLLVTLEDTIVAERSAERVFESQAHEAALLVERLRTAQQSYVAAGQGADYWMGKLADTRATLERTLAGLASSATADGARTAADRAAGLVGQHARLDARARTYISQEQRLMASDLIFTEMSGMTGEIARYTDQARTSSARWRIRASRRCGSSRSTCSAAPRRLGLLVRVAARRARPVAGSRGHAGGAARADERRVARRQRGAACRAGHRTRIDHASPGAPPP